MMNTLVPHRVRHKSTAPVRRSDPAAVTAGVTRGVCRWLQDLGYATLTEFKLGNRRRADIIGLTESGTIVMAEVKSTVQDFRSDDKWLDYVPYCDAFSFAVPRTFPVDILPADCGIVIADAHGAVVMRPATVHRLHPARRKALTLRFAMMAGQRLAGAIDPRF